MNTHNHANHGVDNSESKLYDSKNDFWEERYASKDRVWSGSVNRTLADVVTELRQVEPKSEDHQALVSLDLGCGEGGDVFWCAENGYKAYGLDVSATAITRALKEAKLRNLSSKTRFAVQDLAQWVTTSVEGWPLKYDLITASFLPGNVVPSRTTVLKTALNRLKSEGSLVLLSHAPLTGPSSSGTPHQGHHRFRTPEEELKPLLVDQSEFEIVLAEVRQRDDHLDTVVVLTRAS
ncbi:MAG TPA: class I SAM-dependent methyltransferase [Microbacteriaceae bacterium]|nr:class I SAM-dependent methyltransferase [Microbacteriaceae bacterium]